MRPYKGQEVFRQTNDPTFAYVHVLYSVEHDEVFLYTQRTSLFVIM